VQYLVCLPGWRFTIYEWCIYLNILLNSKNPFMAKQWRGWKIFYPIEKLTFHRWAATTSKDEHEKLPPLLPETFLFKLSIIALLRWKVLRRKLFWLEHPTSERLWWSAAAACIINWYRWSMAAALVGEFELLDDFVVRIFGACREFPTNNLPLSCTGCCSWSRPPFPFIIAELEAHAHKKS
jgi:hypothetical protein